jgi:hypothetical protein
MLIEQAGGQASTGRKRMLDVQPDGAAPAHRLHLRLVGRGLAHRALPPRGAAGRPTSSPLFGKRGCSPRRSERSQLRHPRRDQGVPDEIFFTPCPPSIPSSRSPASSGAGTTSVTRTFENIFRREGVHAAIVEGDSFHRYDRKAMKAKMAEAEAAGNEHFSHFGDEANLFEELEALFRDYAETGTGKARKYLHDAEEAAPYKQDPAPSRRGADCRRASCCSTRAARRGVSTDKVDIARTPTC